MFTQLIEQMAEREGMTEQIKSTNQMAWVGVMCNIWNRAAEEELILQKLKNGCKVLKYLTKKEYDIRCKNY